MIIFFIILFFFSFNYSQSKLTGFKAFHFGLSKNEVKKIVRSTTKLVYNSEAILYSMIHSLTYEKGEVFNTKVTRVSFNFYENKLYSIDFEFKSNEEFVYSTFKEIKTKLDSMYYKENTKKDSVHFQSVWTFKNEGEYQDVVDLSLIKYDAFILSLSISHGKISDKLSKIIDKKDKEFMEF